MDYAVPNKKQGIFESIYSLIDLTFIINSLLIKFQDAATILIDKKIERGIIRCSLTCGLSHMLYLSSTENLKMRFDDEIAFLLPSILIHFNICLYQQ